MIKVTLVLVLLAMLFETTQANHLLVFAAAFFPPEAIGDVIAGYVDGLFGIQVKGQLDQCHNIVSDAELDIIHAVDGLKECSNFFMPLTNKIAKIKDSIVMLLQVTPKIVENI